MSAITDDLANNVEIMVEIPRTLSERRLNRPQQPTAPQARASLSARASAERFRMSVERRHASSERGRDPDVFQSITPHEDNVFNRVTADDLMSAALRLRGGGLDTLNITTIQLVGKLRATSCPFATNCTDPLPPPGEVIPKEATHIQTKLCGPSGEVIPDVNVPLRVPIGAESLAELPMPRFRVISFTVRRNEFARHFGLASRDISALIARETSFIEPRPFKQLLLVANDAVNLVISPDCIHILSLAATATPMETSEAAQLAECFPVLFSAIYCERMHILFTTIRSSFSDPNSPIDPAAAAAVLPPSWELISLEAVTTFAISSLSARTEALRDRADAIFAACLHRPTPQALLALASFKRSAGVALADATVLRDTLQNASRSDETVLLSFENCREYLARLRDADIEAAAEVHVSALMRHATALRSSMPQPAPQRPRLASVTSPAVSTTSSSTSSGAGAWPVPPEPIGDLLDSAVFSSEGVRVESAQLMRRADSVETSISLILDCGRNTLAWSDYVLSMVSVALGFGAVVTGYFGMNLMSGFEELPYFIFWGVGAFVLIAGVLIGITIWNVSKKIGLQDLMTFELRKSHRSKMNIDDSQPDEVVAKMNVV